MGVDYQVKQIYDKQIADVTTSEAKWKDVCKLAGQLYRYEFDNILMVYAQRPHATLVADYDTWRKVDRYVKRGSKGIAIFPSQALKPHMRYVFDISDTGGRQQKLTWDLEGDRLESYIKFLVSEGQLKNEPSSDKESLQVALKDFTRTYIRDIMKEDFSERISELLQLSGCVIKEENNKTQELTEMEELLERSILFTVGTRCGFDLSVQEQDFSRIVKYSNEEVVYRLGSLVCDVSCSVLRDFSRNVKSMDKNKVLQATPRQKSEVSAERRQDGRNNNEVHRSGWNPLSGYPDTAGQRKEASESREVRNVSNELSQGERANPVQLTLPLWEAGREDGGSERGGISVAGSADAELSGEEQTRESQFHHGDVETERAGEDAGGGNRTTSDCEQVSLEEDDVQLNRELDEIDTFGQSQEANHQQASFFYGENQNSTTSKYTYVSPKKELVVPREYVTNVVLRGSGFQGGKKRIYEMFQTESNPSQRAKLLKKEYGLGGAGWPMEGYGLHGYDTFKSQGLRFQWRDAEGEKEGYVSWSGIEKEISVLMLSGEYYQLEITTPTLISSTDSYEEDENIIDMVEVEKPLSEEDIDAILEADRQLADDRYEARRREEEQEYTPLTDEEAAEEDRRVTMAEYGEEMEAENGLFANQDIDVELLEGKR